MPETGETKMKIEQVREIANKVLEGLADSLQQGESATRIAPPSGPLPSAFDSRSARA